jgi:murein DD-endopeptidase MepM/ murein hydrolase activator NlpD
MKRKPNLLIAILIVTGIVAGYFYLRRGGQSARTLRVMEWIRNPQAHNDWALAAGARCSDAPFTFPTNGFTGYLWADSFQIRHSHQGIDIFGGTEPGVTPVYAAYDGYLTRLESWKSSVIIRLPHDPLQPERQIWTYYTHMADPAGNSFIASDFPPGTREVFVARGTLLGHQGNFSGDANSPVGVHLHFSIVLDNGQGNFRNELEINNTLDPSPYFGMNLNAQNDDGKIPACLANDGNGAS